MTDAHAASGTSPQDKSQGAGQKDKGSNRRLVLVTIIMLGFAALTWALSLWSRGTTGISNTAGNLPDIFIPAWLTLTIGTVVISLWFAKYILTAERYRDSETTPQIAPSHSH